MTSFVAGDCDTSGISSFINFCLSASSLETIDTTNLDTSSATSLLNAFHATDITSLDVTNWDISNVASMSAMLTSVTLNTTGAGGSSAS